MFTNILNKFRKDSFDQGTIVAAQKMEESNVDIRRFDTFFSHIAYRLLLHFQKGMRRNL